MVLKCIKPNQFALLIVLPDAELPPLSLFTSLLGAMRGVMRRAESVQPKPNFWHLPQLLFFSLFTEQHYLSKRQAWVIPYIYIYLYIYMCVGLALTLALLCLSCVCFWMERRECLGWCHHHLVTQETETCRQKRMFLRWAINI